ncbi:aldehyde-activating protein [Agaricicola taiwanensis]|uniref:Aldehyde-activating protein n=1 Tax=Agaricicola taiwanensis TaxID=591372 RepID=A0A8J2VP51_9RHOB|nr:GFA family protein [Agaricicola taiwanensis]GGE36794.1 aldehyde-activating protein [Agaricicola taiwanensis]
MSEDTLITGGCQCGAVRYAFSGSFEAMVCHCRMCQRASGGPYMAYATPSRERLRWTQGNPGRYQSSDKAERLYCRACGTPLAFRNLARGTVDLTAGSLDNPELARPSWALGIESKRFWVDHVGELPGRTTTDWMADNEAPPQSSTPDKI